MQNSEVWSEFEKIATEQGLIKFAAKKKEEKEVEEGKKEDIEETKKEEKKKKKIEKKKMKKAFICDLLKIADVLDEKGFVEEAVRLDNVVQDLLK